mmetsp:Transcript_24322/g.61887  ORF Transcript_24322/g.61887 Transcript_24322/m.61887 type:complete len:466 (-) Transcript_24322:437-1834(-)
MLWLRASAATCAARCSAFCVATACVASKLRLTSSLVDAGTCGQPLLAAVTAGLGAEPTPSLLPSPIGSMPRVSAAMGCWPALVLAPGSGAGCTDANGDRVGVAVVWVPILAASRLRLRSSLMGLMPNRAGEGRVPDTSSWCGCTKDAAADSPSSAPGPGGGPDACSDPSSPEDWCLSMKGRSGGKLCCCCCVCTPDPLLSPLGCGCALSYAAPCMPTLLAESLAVILPAAASSAAASLDLTLDAELEAVVGPVEPPGAAVSAATAGAPSFACCEAAGLAVPVLPPCGLRAAAAPALAARCSRSRRCWKMSTICLKVGRALASGCQHISISALYCANVVPVGPGSSLSGGRNGRLVSVTTEKMTCTLIMSSNGCCHVSISHMMMAKLYTSPAGPICESRMTSGAVQRGLVVLDTMITDEEWPSMRARPKSAILTWKRGRSRSMVRSSSRLGDLRSPWMTGGRRVCR